MNVYHMFNMCSIGDCKINPEPPKVQVKDKRHYWNPKHEVIKTSKALQSQRP